MSAVINTLMRTALLCMTLSALPALAEETPDIIYWDTATGKVLRARIPADADYWQLIPTFAEQISQSYCSVASAITVLNAMSIKKPVDPRYAPYSYFTQSNFFSPQASKIIRPQTVLSMGMTREEVMGTLAANGAHANSVAGNTFTDDSLRDLLARALGDDGQFVLANYLRASLGQHGYGHWSVLAAYDRESDHVLILDVAKYKYPPTWVSISALHRAIATTDATSGKPRGLVLVSMPKP